MSVSIIIPAYNEEKRIEPFLVNLSLFLKKSFAKFEVVLVNDGSNDNTLSIFNAFKNNNNNVKLISYEHNKGKGFAVSEGLKHSTGDFIIFLDADNSFELNDVTTTIARLQSSDIVIGNKYAKWRTFDFRLLLGKCCNFIVNRIFLLDVDDCFSGLKGLRRDIAQELFNKLHYERWLYDVELLLKARKRNYTIVDFPVEAKIVKGSKVTIVDPLKIFFQILKMKYIDRTEKW